MPLALQAGLWGLLSGSALLIGALARLVRADVAPARRRDHGVRRRRAHLGSVVRADGRGLAAREPGRLRAGRRAASSAAPPSSPSATSCSPPGAPATASASTPKLARHATKPIGQWRRARARRAARRHPGIDRHRSQPARRRRGRHGRGGRRLPLQPARGPVERRRDEGRGQERGLRLPALGRNRARSPEPRPGRLSRLRRRRSRPRSPRSRRSPPARSWR